MKQISGKRNELFSGLVAHVVINTKHKRFPSYLSSFIDHVVLDTKGFFEPVHLKQVTKPELLPQKIRQEIKPKEGDSIYQLGFRLAAEIDYKDYTKYIDELIESDLDPYIEGCHFLMSQPIYFSSISERYRGIAKCEGDKTLSIYDLDFAKSDFIKDFQVLFDTPFADMIYKSNKTYETEGVIKIENCINEQNEIIIRNILILYDIKFSIQ